MKPIAIVYVTDMARSLPWYRAVAPDAAIVSTSKWWSELSFDGGSLALHGVDELPAGAGQVGLAFEASTPLEELVATWATSRISPLRGIADEGFGRSVLLEDPDGLTIQVNEHDPEHYP